MTDQVQMTLHTKDGTSNNLLNAPVVETATTTSGPSRDDLNKFSEIVQQAISQNETKEMPCVEVPRRVIEHFNRGKLLAGFDAVGYFVHSGVKIYETGKREQAQVKEKITMEQLLHGGR